MSWRIANRLGVGLAVLLLAATAFVACKGPSGEISTAGKIGDFTFGAYIGTDGKTHWQGNGPSDFCVCLEFLDKDNQVIGHGTISDGAGAGVIDGRAIMWRAKVIKCSEIANCGAGTSAPSGTNGMLRVPDVVEPQSTMSWVQAQQAPSRASLQWQKVWCGTIEIDEFNGGDGASLIHNGSGEFEVLVSDTSSNEALLAVWPLMEQGPGAIVPSNVRVNFMSQVIPEAFGGRMVFARRSAFTAFSCDVNAHNDYALLGHGAFDLAIGNGWHIIEVPVAMADMNLGVNVTNSVRVKTQALGDSAARFDSASYTIPP